MTRLDSLLEELRQEFPGFRLIPKEESRLMRALYRTLGMRWWNKAFLTDYTTVLIYRVYLPRDLWGTDAAYGVLRHERVHMRDARRSWIVPFVLSYLFLLPAGFTLRAWWELRAYEESMRVELEDTGAIADDTIEFIAERFTGSDYLFMCPFPGFVRRRLGAARKRLLAEAAREAARSQQP